MGNGEIVDFAVIKPLIIKTPRAIILLVVASAILLVSFLYNQPAVTTMDEAAAYKEQLRSQVDTETGEARSGRDPSSQQQTSLSSAASSPSGAGQHIDTKESGVSGNNSQDAVSADVNDPGQTGLNSSGCYYDYGLPGQQCLPAHAAHSGTLNCTNVRKYFPGGVIVSGTDRFHMDSDHDGIACDADD